MVHYWPKMHSGTTAWYWPGTKKKNNQLFPNHSVLRSLDFFCEVRLLYSSPSVLPPARRAPRVDSLPSPSRQRVPLPCRPRSKRGFVTDSFAPTSAPTRRPSSKSGFVAVLSAPNNTATPHAKLQEWICCRLLCAK